MGDFLKSDQKQNQKTNKKGAKQKMQNKWTDQTMYFRKGNSCVRLHQLSCDELRTLPVNTWVYIRLKRKDDTFAKPPESTWYRSFPQVGSSETLFRFGTPCLPYSLPYGTYGEEWTAYLMPDISFSAL